MAENFSRYPRRQSPDSRASEPADRLPTNEELLYELRKHGVKPAMPKELPGVSRRTRDYLLIAGIGSGCIVFSIVKVLSGSETASIMRLALTGVGAYCGLLWYIFYGVMSRY